MKIKVENNSNKMDTMGCDNRISIGEHVVLVQRGSRGIWTADFHFIDNNGVRKHGRRSFRTRNRRIAEQKARELENHLATGEFRIQPVKSMSIDESITAFIASKKADGRSHKTLIKYEGELRNFAKHLKEKCGITAPGRISVWNWDKYKAHRTNVDGRNAYTVYNYGIIIRTWLKWCKRRGIIPANPLTDLESNMPRRQRHPAATMAQVNVILAGAVALTFAVLATAAFTGLRIGEITALLKNDVDLEAGIIHVRRREAWGPKTESSERDVPIHRRLLAILLVMPKNRGSYFFSPPPSKQFPEGGHHINPRDFNVEFQTIAAANGFPVGRKDAGLTQHALRRFFKTFCLDSGVPKPMVDSWLGHQDQSNMDYFYYDSQKSKEWMARVPFGEPSDQDLRQLSGDQHEQRVI